MDYMRLQDLMREAEKYLSSWWQIRSIVPTPKGWIINDRINVSLSEAGELGVCVEASVELEPQFVEYAKANLIREYGCLGQINVCGSRIALRQHTRGLVTPAGIGNNILDAMNAFSDYVSKFDAAQIFGGSVFERTMSEERARALLLDIGRFLIEEPAVHSVETGGDEFELVVNNTFGVVIWRTYIGELAVGVYVSCEDPTALAGNFKYNVRHRMSIEGDRLCIYENTDNETARSISYIILEKINDVHRSLTPLKTIETWKY